MTAISVHSAGTFEVLPIGELSESPWNPRKHFDQAKLQELAASMRELGVLTPLLARPRANGATFTYELAAGHRRFRAAQLAGLSEVPVLIREMDDVQFLEVLTIENLQRDDVHPLEEAQGYADLIKEAAYDAQRIADRVGKSVKYVYDRIKLLHLIPPVKKLFLDGRITAGHAILLARLKKDDQQRAIDPENADHNGSGRSALWEHESASLFHPEEEDRENEGPYDGLKARSVRELEHWIDRNVRLDLKRDTDPMLFPEIAEEVVPAAAEKRRVIPITYDHHVMPDAKGDGERTYGPRSWKRADGEYESATCEYSILGAVVVGPARGEAFQVCVRRDKCKVHWKDEVRAAEKRAAAKKGESSSGDRAGAENARAKEVARQEAENRKEEESRLAFEKATPALIAAAIDVIKKAPIKPGSPAWKILLDRRRMSGRALKALGQPKTAEDVVRLELLADVIDRTGYHYAFNHFAQAAKPWGIDVDAIVAAQNPKPAAEKKPAAKSAKKKAR